MDKLFIVMPAYNESANIAKVVKKWQPLLQLGSADSRLIVFNDGSKDDTLAKCRKLEEEFPRFTVVDKANSGHGATCLQAYHYALDHDADYIFQTDSDDQTNPDEMKGFWDNREQYDIQIGVRKGRQDGLARVIVTKVLKLVLYLIFGVSVRDANTPFRLISRKALQSYLEITPPDFFLANALMAVTAVYQHDRIQWHDITFRPRAAGTNSMNLKKIFRIGVKALSEFAEAKRKLVARNGRKGLHR